MIFFFFFFSSRRRHTRFDCDWSSDVCSSDLARGTRRTSSAGGWAAPSCATGSSRSARCRGRSEEHTSELQSQSKLVCRLLLEKKKTHEPDQPEREVRMHDRTSRVAQPQSQSRCDR